MVMQEFCCSSVLNAVAILSVISGFELHYADTLLRKNISACAMSKVISVLTDYSFTTYKTAM